jgi:hypothetical protein
MQHHITPTPPQEPNADLYALLLRHTVQLGISGSDQWPPKAEYVRKLDDWLNKRYGDVQLQPHHYMQLVADMSDRCSPDRFRVLEEKDHLEEGLVYPVHAVDMQWEKPILKYIEWMREACAIEPGTSSDLRELQCLITQMDAYCALGKPARVQKLADKVAQGPHRALSSESIHAMVRCLLPVGLLEECLELVRVKKDLVWMETHELLMSWMQRTGDSKGLAKLYQHVERHVAPPTPRMEELRSKAEYSREAKVRRTPSCSCSRKPTKPSNHDNSTNPLILNS